MTLTESYARTHAALRAVADTEGLSPFAVRVLVAIVDRGGSATTHELDADLQAGASMVRRALVEELYPGGFAAGTASTGGPRRRGVVTRVALLHNGRRAVMAVRRQVEWNTTREEVAA